MQALNHFTDNTQTSVHTNFNPQHRYKEMETNYNFVQFRSSSQIIESSLTPMMYGSVHMYM